MTSSWRQSSMTSRTALVCELRLQRSAARRLRRHHVNLLRLLVVTRQRMRDTWPATWHPAVGRRLAPPSGRLTVGGGVCTNNICQLIYVRKTGVLYHTNVTPSSYAHLRWNIGLPFRNQPACHLLLACVVTAECRVSRIICSASRHILRIPESGVVRRALVALTEGGTVYPEGGAIYPEGGAIYPEGGATYLERGRGHLARGRGHLHWGRSHLPWGRGHLPRGWGHLAPGRGHLPWGRGHLPWGRGHLPWGRGHIPWGRGHLPRGQPLCTGRRSMWRR